MYNGFYICPKSKKDWFIWSLWFFLFVVLCVYSVLFFLNSMKCLNIELQVSDLYQLDFLPVPVESHFAFYGLCYFYVFYVLVSFAFYLFFNKIYLSKKNKIFFMHKLNKEQSLGNKIAWKNYLESLKREVN